MADYHPRTDVSFAATKPFIKAFPKEAFAMHKKFNTPTWSLRIIEEDQEVLRQINEQMSTMPPVPPSFVNTTAVEAQPSATVDPIVLPAPRFEICAPAATSPQRSTTAVPSTEQSIEINTDVIVVGVAALIFLGAGYCLYRAWWCGLPEVVAVAEL